MKGIAFLFAVSTLAAQTIEIKSLCGAAALDGVWKQKTGDDARWADRLLDDSRWANVEMPQPAAPGARGYTWHRIHLRMLEPLPAEPLFVLVGPLFPAYEIYINGELDRRFRWSVGRTQWSSVCPSHYLRGTGKSKGIGDSDPQLGPDHSDWHPVRQPGRRAMKR